MLSALLSLFDPSLQLYYRREQSGYFRILSSNLWINWGEKSSGIINENKLEISVKFIEL